MFIFIYIFSAIRFPLSKNQIQMWTFPMLNIFIFGLIFIAADAGIHSRTFGWNGPNANGTEGNGQGGLKKLEMDEWKVAIDQILEELNSTILANLDANADEAEGNVHSKEKTKIGENASQGEKSSDQDINKSNLKKMGMGKNRGKRQIGQELKNKCERKAMKKLFEHKMLFGQCMALWNQNLEVVQNAIEAKKDGFFDALCPVSQQFWLFEKTNQIDKSTKKTEELCESSMVPLKAAQKTGAFREEVGMAVENSREELASVRALAQAAYNAFNEEFFD